MPGQTNDYSNVRLSEKLEENVRLFKDIFKNDAILHKGTSFLFRLIS